MMSNLNRTPCSVDRIQHEEFIRAELAIECIAAMIGFVTLEMLDEEKKASPDTAKLAELTARKQELLNEREAIYLGDPDMQKRCIEKYAPTIKKRYE